MSAWFWGTDPLTAPIDLSEYLTTMPACPACAGAMPVDQMGLPLQQEHEKHIRRTPDDDPAA